MRSLLMPALLAGCCTLAGAVHAADAATGGGSSNSDSSDLDALSLADKPVEAPARASDWRLFGELSRAQRRARNGNVGGLQDRLSLDLGYDRKLTPEWRVVFSDRLDLVRERDAADKQHNVNTLREAYASYSVNPQWLVDAGRINPRYGMALGYNPTDFMRANAVRSVVSSDPASLRQNRLGTFMLRNQTLWNGGGLTALVAPKLGNRRSDDALSLDVGATNARDQWLVSASQELAAGFSPQLSLYQQRGGKVQLGLNASTLLNDASVAYAEWSGGRSASQLSGLPRQPASESELRFRSRYALGVRYTLSKATLTLELEGNSAAASRAQWQQLMQGPVQIYGLYRQNVAALQELPTRRALFTHLQWDDAFVSHLDLSAFVRRDMIDHSRISWGEARYHWESLDLVFRMQFNQGRVLTDFGAMPQSRILQLMLVYYLM